MFCKDDLMVACYEFDENKELQIEIETDVQIDPRDDDNIGNMVCFHRRYDLGDSHQDIEELICSIIDEDELEYLGFDTEYFDGWDEMEEFLFEEVNAAIVLPLYLYDHSGITISTSPFSSRWDSGQIGFIFITEKEIHDEWIDRPSDATLISILKSQVDLYDKYIRGDVYNFTVLEHTKCPHCGHVNYDIIDSCTGFYGMDWEENGLFEMAGVKSEQLVEVNM